MSAAAPATCAMALRSTGGGGSKRGFMTSSVPRIAIPEPTSTDEAYNQRSLPQYVRAVEAAGGTRFRFLCENHRHAGEPASLMLGDILPGSPADVDPTRYGQQAVKECAAKDPAREAVDDLLLRHAFDSRKANPGNLLWIAVVKRVATGQPHTGLAARIGGCGPRPERLGSR